jgi:FAD synthetase
MMIQKKKSRKNIRKVMIFGVFDRLHPGHLDFFRQARKHGDELIAVVARDQVVMELKNKTPFHSGAERLAMVREVPEVTRAVLGDEVSGSYGVIAAHQPDVICVGYDQRGLAEDIDLKMKNAAISTIPICRLAPYRPKHLHTSLLALKKN